MTYFSGFIWAECNHLESSFAAGIQVIVQSTNVSEVHKLYVNQSMDLRTPVTVPVKRDGEYQVSIFAIRDGMGILGSSVHYTSITVNKQSVTSAAATSAHDISAIPATGMYLIILSHMIILLCRGDICFKL